MQGCPKQKRQGEKASRLAQKKETSTGMERNTAPQKETEVEGQWKVKA